MLADDAWTVSAAPAPDLNCAYTRDRAAHSRTKAGYETAKTDMDMDVDMDVDMHTDVGSNEPAVSVFTSKTIACLDKNGNSSESIVAVHGVSSGNHVSLSLSNGFIQMINAETLFQSELIRLTSHARVMCFNRTADFLMAGDSSGVLQFIHRVSGRIIFSLEIQPILNENGINMESINFKWIGFTGAQSDDGLEEITLIVEPAIMIQFSDINFKKISVAIESLNMSLASDAYNAISMEVTNCQVSSYGVMTNVVDVAYCVSFKYSNFSKKVFLAGEGSEPLTIWSQSLSGEMYMVDSISKKLLSGADSIIKLQVDSLRGYLLILDNSHTLSLWDIKTLIKLKSFSGVKVLDFNNLPTRTSAESAKKEFKISLITEGGIIQIRSMPSFKLLHQLHASTQTLLLLSDGSQNILGEEETPQSIFFIEGLNSDSCDFVNRFYLRSVAETCPLEKFNALIERRKFVEAEFFAETFQFDKQFVLKSKLSYLLTECENHKQWEQLELDTFVDQCFIDMRSIQDIQFKVEFCLKLCIPSESSAYKAMIYARNLVLECANQIESDLLSTLIVHINDTIRRFGTFQMFESYSRLCSDIGSNFNAKKWQMFRTLDLISEIRSYMRQNNIKMGILLWRRHYLDGNMLNYIIDILSDLPDELCIDDIISWLQCEIIPLLDSLELRAKFIKWLENKCRTLESLQQSPHDALRLVRLAESPYNLNQYPDSFKHDIQAFGLTSPAAHVAESIIYSQTSRVSVYGIETSSHPLVISIDTLREQLEDLVHLWEAHGFYISLAHYCQTTPSSIALDLLDRVASLELLPDAIEQNFLKYIQRHDLNKDSLLSEYCLEIMDQTVEISKSLTDAPWEARVLAILESMDDLDSKASVIFEIMCRTPVPWSNAVDRAIEQAMGWKSVMLYEQLQTQFQLMRLRRMIFGHGIVNYNIADGSRSKALVKFVLSKLDNFHAIDEAMQIVNIYPNLSKIDAYSTRLRVLFAAGLIDRALKLLKTGSEDQEVSNLSSKLHTVEALVVGEEVSVWLMEVLENTVLESESDDSISEYNLSTFNWSINAAVDLVSEMISMRESFKTLLAKGIESVSEFPAANHLTSSISCCTVDSLKALKNIRDLSLEFGVRISLEAYTCDDAARRSILAKFAKSVFKYGEETTIKYKSKGKGKGAEVSTKPSRDQSAISRTELYRLAEILGFERSSLAGIIAEEAASNGDFKTALLLCKELYEKFKDESTAATLRRIALLITSYCSQNKNVFSDMKESKLNFRLTSSILELSQRALLVCSPTVVSECLDEYKSYEIQHNIFTQCDAGDYDSLINKEAFNLHEISPTSNPFSSSYNHSSSSSSSASSSSSSSTSSTSMYQSSSSAPSGSQDTGTSIAADRFASDLFDDFYHESGLILSTERAMSQVTSFTLDIASSNVLQNQDNGTTLSGLRSPVKGAKKNKGPSIDPVTVGRTLSDFLKGNRLLLSALHVWHRSIELRLRFMENNSDSNYDEIETDYQGHLSLVLKLTENVLSSRYIDQGLAFGCLLTAPYDRGFEAFRNGMQTTGADYDRLIKFASIGIAAGTVWNQRSFKVSCQELAANARWWFQFKLLNIPFDESQFRLSRDGTYQKRIVSSLLVQTNLDITTVLEFARAYRIEDDYVILEYIRQLLLDKQDTYGYQSLITGIFEDIDNKSKLQDILLNICLPLISPYDYEKIGFIFNQILKIDPLFNDAKRGIQVLELLSHYNRTVPPTHAELLTAKRLSAPTAQDDESLSSLLDYFPQSCRNLPYHLLVTDAWTYIESELSEKTLSRLLPMSKVLGLASDDLYENYLNRVINQLNSARTEQLILKIKFSDVKSLVYRIQNLETSTIVTTKLGDAFPCGVDRLSAYKVALSFAEKWVQEASLDVKRDPSNESAIQLLQHTEKILSTIHNSLIFTETEHQLRTLKLTQFIDYIGNPEVLLTKLYFKQSEAALSVNSEINLHSVVNEIAKRYKIDSDKLRTILLQMGLAEEVPMSPEEKAMYLPSLRVQINSTLKSQGERSIQSRLLYLIKSVPLSQGIQILLHYSREPSSKIKTLNRVRALNVLLQLASPSDLAAKNVDYKEMRNYMQMLLYFADFEELRIVTSLKDFMECEKEALVRSLWVNHNNEPKVVQLICNISLDYKIFDIHLWENALHRLVSQGAIHFVLGIIEHVSYIPQLLQMKHLPSLWNAIVIQSLKLVRIHELKPDEMDIYLYNRVLSLIQKCPFAMELDHSLILSLLTQSNSQINTSDVEDNVLLSYSLIQFKGLATLPPSEITQKAMDSLLENMSIKLLFSGWNTLTTASSIQIGNASIQIDVGKEWILQSIYRKVLRSELYSHLAQVTSSQVTSFINYLIHIDRLDGLIKAMMLSNRENDARKIVSLYFKRYPRTDIDMDELVYFLERRDLSGKDE